MLFVDLFTLKVEQTHLMTLKELKESFILRVLFSMDVFSQYS